MSTHGEAKPLRKANVQGNIGLKVGGKKQLKVTLASRFHVWHWTLHIPRKETSQNSCQKNPRAVNNARVQEPGRKAKLNHTKVLPWSMFSQSGPFLAPLKCAKSQCTSVRRNWNPPPSLPNPLNNFLPIFRREGWEGKKRWFYETSPVNSG